MASLFRVGLEWVSTNFPGDRCSGILKNDLGGDDLTSRGQAVIFRCGKMVMEGVERIRQNMKARLTVLLHNGQDLDNDLGRGSDQDLLLTPSLGVDNVVQTVVKDGDSDHFAGIETFLRDEKRLKRCV